MRGTRFGIGRLPWTTSESSIRRTTGTGARFAWGHYECIGNDSGGSREAEQPALIVGQDGILRAGWQPAPGLAFLQGVPAGYQPAAGCQPAPQLLPNSRSGENSGNIDRKEHTSEL